MLMYLIVLLLACKDAHADGLSPQMVVSGVGAPPAGLREKHALVYVKYDST